MIQLIIGSKGSGKTKTIIEMMNEAVAETNGHIVCIEKGMRSTYNISTEVRLVDVDDYGIHGAEPFYGFIMGVLAGDYDIEQVFVDGSLKVVDVKEMGKLLDMISYVAPVNVKFVFTLSLDSSELTEEIKKYL